MINPGAGKLALADPKRAALGRGFAALLAMGVALMCAAAPARALGPLDAMAGYSYYSGPDGQTTFSPMGEIEANRKRCSLSLGASAFEDNQSGNAWGVTGAVKLPLSPRAKIVLAGTGFIGDSTAGAWRARVGAEIEIRKGRTLEASIAHYDDDLHALANALGIGLEATLRGHFSGSTNVSLERANGLTGENVGIGLSWQPAELVEFAAEGGISRNSTGLTGLLPSRLVTTSQGGGPGRSANAGRGRGGGSGASPAATGSASNATSATLQVGVRLHF